MGGGRARESAARLIRGCTHGCPLTIGDLFASGFEVPLPNLTSLQIEVSSACNLRCPQCFNQIPEHVTALLSKELWDNRIKPHLPHVSDAHLVGIGEPLMNPRFFDFAADARAAGCKVHTTSNLQLLTPEKAERLVATEFSTLSFSCDGATEETYSSIRVRGTLNKLERSLDMIARAKTAQGGGPALILNFGAVRRNITELPAVVEFAARHKVQMIIAYHNVAYVELEASNSLFEHQELSDHYFLQAARTAARYGINFLYPGLFSAPIHHEPGPVHCHYPFNHVYIYSDGRVGPCCMDFPNRIILGDLIKHDLPTIWNSQSFRELRRQMCGQPDETCRFCVSHFRMDITDPRYLYRFPGAQAYIANAAKCASPYAIPATQVGNQI